ERRAGGPRVGAADHSRWGGVRGFRGDQASVGGDCRVHPRVPGGAGGDGGAASVALGAALCRGGGGRGSGGLAREWRWAPGGGGGGCAEFASAADAGTGGVRAGRRA